MSSTRLLVVMVVLSCSCGLWSCDDPSPRGREPKVGSAEQPIIYGNDDRQEVYEYPDATLRKLTRSSVLALVREENLLRTNSGRVELVSNSLQKSYELCGDERFVSQPTAGWCTGVLIDDDLVLSAGHCFTSDLLCENYAFVFDYFYEGPDQLATLSAADVYSCKRLVVREMSAVAGKALDYAIVQLDRPVLAPRTPAPITKGVGAKGQHVTVIGAPSGLPFKIDAGTHILDARTSQRDYFVMDSDTFEGSSGSPVFDDSGALLGLLVRGGVDYVASDAGCNVVNTVDPAEVPEWEEATYLSNVISALCSSGYPSPRLCDVEPSCGDGFCTSDERDGSCMEDCTSSEACVTPPCTKAPSAPPVLLVPDGGLQEGELPPLPHPSCSLASTLPLSSVLDATVFSLSALLLHARRRRQRARAISRRSTLDPRRGPARALPSRPPRRA